jgi:hypothetical protein
VVVAACCAPKGGGGGTTPGPPPATCQKDRACNPAELAPCAQGVKTIALADVLASGDSLSGQTLSIAGPLHMGVTMCTKMFCGPERPCCNKCSAALVLAAQAPSSPLGGQSVRLEGDGMSCPGDDTGVCCPYDADGQAVVASGTLVSEGDAQRGWIHRLEGASLCRP